MALLNVAPFVGRSQEMGWLERWLGEAAAGQPRVVLIEGDAGIGKTRLLHEARAIAGRLGMQVCFGRCREDLALPYLPFVEWLRPQLERLPDDARRALGADHEIVRTLLYDAGAATADARATRTSPAPADAPTGPLGAAPADREKLQLLLAMGNVIVKLAQARPLLVVVDDAHWADPLSLDLFEHLAFAVSDQAVPVLIMATHRPVTGDERLAHLTARLGREESCRSFTLRGLSEGEIRDLVGGLGLKRPSQQLVATVSEATHGNPLFVQEVLHDLARQDALQEQGGYLVTATAPLDFRFPEQMTAATLARAHGVSDAGRRLLTFASFLGDRFSLAAIGAVSGVSEEEALDLLEEAMRRQILRGEGAAFSFAHPLVRRVFYQEPSAPRRQRLHRQIAERLERLYAADLDAHLLEIAHHVVRAGPAAETAVVLDWARRAGDRAFRVFAWSDAARYYEAALAAGEEATSALSTPERAELHYRAGLARYHDQDVGPCRHHYDKAIEAYRQAGDLPGLARALMEQARTALAIVPLGTVVDLGPLDEVLAALGEREPGLRGHIIAVMAEAYRNGRQAADAKRRGQDALEIGRRLADDHLCAYASFALGLAHINDLDVRPALEAWQSAVVHARRADDVIREGRALHRIPLALTLLGRLGEADAVAARACAATQTSHDWGNFSLGLSHRASVAAARGAFDLVEAHARETIVMVSRSRFPWGGFRSLLALACARALRGAWTEAEDALDVLVEPGRVFDDAGPVVLAFARIFRRWARAHAEGGDDGLEPLDADALTVVGADTYSLAPLCALVELGEICGSPAVAEAAAQRLGRAAERGIVFSSGWMFLLPRVFGVAAALGRRWEAAERHFREAVDVATVAGARPELARTYLDWARMLHARRGDGARAEAGDLVGAAASIFAELGMAPFVSRACEVAAALGVDVSAKPAALAVQAARAEPGEPADPLSEREVDVLIRLARGRNHDEIAGDLILGRQTVAGHVRSLFEKISVGDDAAATAYAVDKGLAGEPPALAVGTVSPSLRIILVSDVVASSALIHRSGDVKAHDLMLRHNALLRRCLAAHQGTEVTHTGDGIEASFRTASDAVDCAVAIQKGCVAHNHEHPADQVHVRIGLNAGEPIATEGGRLFGAAVHVAFAVCGRAGPGQILVSDVVAQLIAGKGFRTIGHGRVSLKELGRTRLHEIVWQDTV